MLLIAGSLASLLGVVGLTGARLLVASARAHPDSPGACGWHDVDGIDEPCNDTALKEGGGTFLTFLSVFPIAGGVAMLAIGGVRYHHHRHYLKKWPRKVRVQRSVHGTWTAGVLLRF